MKPYNINDIADYIILRLTSEEDVSLVNLKLQKLLYYVQAWSLGINGSTMFEGKFQAWVHGPVNRTIYDRFYHKSLYGFIDREDVMNPVVMESLAETDIEFIDYILENYAGYNGTQLEKMTHEELPWREARGNIALTSRCTTEISEESMKTFYGEKWAQINSKTELHTT